MQANTPTRSTALSLGQGVILVAAGAILWFLAALLLRAIEPVGAFAVPGVFILYALVIPGTVPFIPLVRRLARLRGDQVLLGVTIVTATASLLDANALVWWPSLYGANPAAAGAAVLWGVGVGLLLGIVMNRPTAR